jgi:hypothetical protein
LAKLRNETKAICARFPVPGLNADMPKSCSAAA